MGDCYDGRVSNEESDEMWKFISEFICWEFCKASALEGSTEDNIATFFKNMILQKASKEVDKIQMCEAVAKFIEQVNNVVNEKKSNNFLDYYADLMVKSSNNLQPKTENLIETIQHFLATEKKRPNLKRDEKLIFVTIQGFSQEAFQSLPLPYLVKMRREAKLNYSGKFEKTFKPPSEDAIMLLQQIVLSEDNLMKVRRNIEEDNLFQNILSNKLSCNEQKDVEESASSFIEMTIRHKDKEDETQKISRKCSSTSRRKEKDKTYYSASKDLAISQPKVQLKRIDYTHSVFDDMEIETPPRTIPSISKKHYKSSLSSVKTELDDSPKNEHQKRKRNPWTDKEEELLVKGVNKYGTGHWSLIRSDGGLGQRSVRDLYDKWKNIEKYNHLKQIEKRILLKKKK